MRSIGIETNQLTFSSDVHQGGTSRYIRIVLTANFENYVAVDTK